MPFFLLLHSLSHSWIRKWRRKMNMRHIKFIESHRYYTKWKRMYTTCTFVYKNEIWRILFSKQALRSVHIHIHITDAFSQIPQFWECLNECVCAPFQQMDNQEKPKLKKKLSEKETKCFQVQCIEVRWEIREERRAR